MSAYTHQKVKFKYIDCIRLETDSQGQSNGTNKAPYDRAKQCQERKSMNVAERNHNGSSTSAAGTVEIMKLDDEIASILTPDCVGIDCVRPSFLKTYWVAASPRFTTRFVNNPLGHKCNMCDRQ
ncbi:uncharacterized protein TNCV_4512681 [Trichonephila clavipes]|nr:uncharacterized protein TNCV_4512681 [Trichonephila clavipes]